MLIHDIKAEKRRDDFTKLVAIALAVFVMIPVMLLLNVKEIEEDGVKFAITVLGLALCYILALVISSLVHKSPKAIKFTGRVIPMRKPPGTVIDWLDKKKLKVYGFYKFKPRRGDVIQAWDNNYYIVTRCHLSTDPRGCFFLDVQPTPGTVYKNNQANEG